MSWHIDWAQYGLHWHTTILVTIVWWSCLLSLLYTHELVYWLTINEWWCCDVCIGRCFIVISLKMMNLKNTICIKQSLLKVCNLDITSLWGPTWFAEIEKQSIYKLYKLFDLSQWPMKMEQKVRFDRIEMSMIRWMYQFGVKDRKSNTQLWELLGLEHVSLMIQRGRLRLFGGVEH